MDNFKIIQDIAIWGIPVLFAITVHEVAHGWVANKLGDPTAKMMGRITLNPAKHIDPIGTVVVPIGLLILGGFIFGWAKPVPIDWRNLKNPKKDIALVAIAGPASNLLMAIMWAFIAKIGLSIGGTSTTLGTAMLYMGKAGITINVILMVLNLLPIPPLDGSRVLANYLQGKVAYYYSRVEPYGFFILLFLIIIGVLGKIIMPPIEAIRYILYQLILL